MHLSSIAQRMILFSSSQVQIAGFRKNRQVFAQLLRHAAVARERGIKVGPCTARCQQHRCCLKARTRMGVQHDSIVNIMPQLVSTEAKVNGMHKGLAAKRLRC